MDQPPGTERVRRWPMRLGLALIVLALAALAVFVVGQLAQI